MLSVHIGMLRIPVIVIACGYIASMLIWPWIAGSGSWLYVQNVWGAWQSLNVGMLALISSVVALYASRYSAEQKRKSQEIAAKAFLPEAASELIGYLEDSSLILVKASELSRTVGNKTPNDFVVPLLPGEYKAIFYRYIVSAKEPNSRFVALILEKLQVHHSRLKSLVEKEFGPKSTYAVNTRNVTAKIAGMAELHALVSRLFDYARGGRDLDVGVLKRSEIQNSLANMKIDASSVPELEKRIEKYKCD